MKSQKLKMDTIQLEWQCKKWGIKKRKKTQHVTSRKKRAFILFLRCTVVTSIYQKRMKRIERCENIKETVNNGTRGCGLGLITLRSFSFISSRM